jgi:hypothetical protein
VNEKAMAHLGLSRQKKPKIRKYETYSKVGEVNISLLHFPFRIVRKKEKGIFLFF